MNPHSLPIQTWLSHIRSLAFDIGPRGSTTEGEKRGAEYCQSVFARLGFSPSLETFPSARSIFQPHVITSIALIAAFIIYPLFGTVSAVIAAFISILFFASDLLELGFRNNLLRFLIAKGQSQNVFAVLPPAGEHKRDLILVGHIDSQRTPLIFRSKPWVDAYKAFTTIAFVGFALQCLLYLLGIFTGWSWLWYPSIFSAICALLLAAICIQADATPFTAGANDNASAVGMVLTLAETLKVEPLQHTRLWLVCTGCEEVQHYGAIDFFRSHHPEMKSPRALIFEMLGCCGPAWLEREGIIVPFFASHEMLRLAQQTAVQYPEYGAYPVRISGGNTEMADALSLGIPAITLMGLEPNGDGPYWHMIEDTFDKMDPESMERTYAFTHAMIRSMDEE
jgi:hypothetical protein